MLNKKEIIIILIITILFGFLTSLMNNLENFIYLSITILVILLLNIFGKKVASFYLDSEIEVRLWETNRYGFAAHQHFKKPFPIGIILPIISKIFFFPFQSFIWMASLVFDVKPKIYRAAKKYGNYKFTEMTEYHLALIAAAGIMINLVSAVIAYFLGFSEFSRLSIYFTLFNMIPLSDLDGNKIFFGSLVMWSFLATIILIGLFSIIFVA